MAAESRLALSCACPVPRAPMTNNVNAIRPVINLKKTLSRPLLPSRSISTVVGFSPMPIVSPLSYKIAVLVFIENSSGEHLLLQRAKSPNLGQWSPIGGKLETAIGESPFECAIRETAEETGHKIDTADLHLFGMIAEKAYEGDSHWLLFLFRCRQPIRSLPPPMEEGRFAFFTRSAIDGIALPDTDRNALWPIYDQYRDAFVSLRADCDPTKKLQITIEQVTPAPTPIV